MVLLEKFTEQLVAYMYTVMTVMSDENRFHCPNGLAVVLKSHKLADLMELLSFEFENKYDLVNIMLLHYNMCT